MKKDLTRKVYRLLNGTGDTSEMRKLSLEDTLAQQMRGVTAPRQRKSGGYNPYEAPVKAKAKTASTPSARPTDLRQLSRWIKQQREIEALKQENDPPKDGRTKK